MEEETISTLAHRIADSAQTMRKSTNYCGDKCPACSGSGYVLVRKCTARERDTYGEGVTAEYAEKCPVCNGGHVEKVEEVKKKADIPTAYYDKKYDAFKWDIYRNEKNEPVDTAKSKRMVETFIRDFDEWENEGMGLYIWSRTKGSGKTFLSSCLCNELMDLKAIRTKFVSASNLLNIAKGADDKALDKYERDPIGLLCNCKLLVIDDIGQKNTGGEWLTDILFRILDERTQGKRVTILTSNLRMSELQFDDRIIDRINKSCQSLQLPEYSVRTREATETKVRLFKRLGLID